MTADIQHQTLSSPLAIASSEVSTSIQPGDLRVVPRLGDASVLITACEDQGRLDGQRADSSIGLSSTHRELPAEQGIAAIGDAQLEAPGQRAAEIAALMEEDKATQKPARRRRLPWPVVLMPVLIIISETLLGSRLGQMMTSLPDTMTWVFGIIVALALTVTAYMTSHALNAWHGRIMTEYGLKLAIAWTVTAMAFLVLYAVAVSGGTESHVDSGAFGAPVVQPGGSTPLVDESTPGVDWVRCLILVTLLLLMFVATVGVHVAYEARSEQARMDDEMAAKDAEADHASPKQRQIRRSAHLTHKIVLLEGCLALLPAVEKRRESIVKAYAAGARAEMSLDQNALWDGAALDAPVGPPSWVAEVERHIATARAELATIEGAGATS